jgi:hypothetical protein
LRSPHCGPADLSGREERRGRINLGRCVLPACRGRPAATWPPHRRPSRLPYRGESP